MAQILDYRGQPVEMKTLAEELAAPSMAGVRTPWWPAVYNLTPDRLGQILAAVDSNDINEYLTLAEQMEESDLHYHSVLSTRKLAVGSLALTIESVTDDKRDEEIADFVGEVMRDDAAPGLLSDLLDAVGKGFSVCEIMWDRSGSQWVPSAYEWRDPRFFMFDRDTGRELRLRDEKDLAVGVPLAPYKFVQHRPKIKTGVPIRGGLARLAAIAYMCKNYSLKDWLAFAEVFGMPIRVGKYDSGATDDQKRELLRAVSNIGTDAACIIPKSMLIDFISASTSTGGDKLFMGLADWLDAQVSKGVLGQTMTADAHASGIGSGQAQVHNEVRQDIRDDDANKLAATIKRDVVRPLVDLNFGPPASGHYPRVRLVLETADDLESLSKSLPPFIEQGLRVEESVIRDKFNLPAPAPDAMLLHPRASSAPAPVTPAEPGVAAPPTTPAATARRIQELTAIELLARVRHGETLTPDQRGLLAAYVATCQSHGTQDEDEIDRLTNEALRGWRQVADPVLAPIIQAAEQAGSADDFVAELGRIAGTTNLDELAQQLATRTFESRALGDVKDKP